jgi:hypothetical protein
MITKHLRYDQNVFFFFLRGDYSLRPNIRRTVDPQMTSERNSNPHCHCRPYRSDSALASAFRPCSSSSLLEGKTEMTALSNEKRGAFKPSFPPKI